MIHFGGTVTLGTSLSPIGAYAGYLLLQSGNFWLAVAFLALSVFYALIAGTMLTRYIINYRRYRAA